MNASELRIGNYVTVNNPEHWPAMAGIPVIVYSFAEERGKMFPASTGSARMRSLSDKWDTFSQMDEFIDPILITDKWLTDLGFAKISLSESPFILPQMPYWVKNGVCLFFNEGEHNRSSFMLGWADQRMGDYHVTYGRWINYVHDLQNSYFGITGKDLKILS